MKLLFIGGTGQISHHCVHEAVRVGHDVAVYNRGNSNADLPSAVRLIRGDVFDDAAYTALQRERFDIVCQFRLFEPEHLERDLRVFAGHCGRYVFIGTASSYLKPPTGQPITEDTPLINPYWDYSRKKARMEAILQSQSKQPFVIVRPSHTTRDKWTTAMSEGDVAIRRMIDRRPVIVPGDGSSLWVITRAQDFAPPFIKLITDDRAVGNAFHLTSDHAFTWDDIYRAMGRAVGVADADIELIHVPVETLLQRRPDWVGPLLGDKAWSVRFDNARVQSVVGNFHCEPNLDAIMQGIAQHIPSPHKLGNDDALHSLFDQLADAQRSI